MKKLLIDSLLEAAGTRLIRGMKDLGGGGLSTALSEVASSGGTGVDVELDEVRCREGDMSPAEIMISESQERMLLMLVARRPRSRTRDPAQVRRPLLGDRAGHRRREPDYAMEGEGGRRPPGRVRGQGAAHPLAQQGAPAWSTPRQRPVAPDTGHRPLDNLAACLPEHREQAMGLPAVRPRGRGQDGAQARAGRRRPAASPERSPARRQGRREQRALRPRPLQRGCGLRGRGVQERRRGRRRADSDGRPSPVRRPFRPRGLLVVPASRSGMADYCTAVELPVVGGKVSFYNEDSTSEEGHQALPHSPGRRAGQGREAHRLHGIRRARETPSSWSGRRGRSSGVRSTIACWAASRRARRRGVTRDPTALLYRAILELIRVGRVTAVHDCSRGGLAVALAEMCIAGGLGARIDLRKVPSQLQARRRARLLRVARAVRPGAPRTPRTLSRLLPERRRPPRR